MKYGYRYQTPSARLKKLYKIDKDTSPPDVKYNLRSLKRRSTSLIRLNLYINTIIFIKKYVYEPASDIKDILSFILFYIDFL